MSKAEQLELFYNRQHPFREGLRLLREIALKTKAEETFKWGGPVYTIAGKNVFGIMAFKEHFGLWFFNGVYLSDPQSVLSGKEHTKAMRHWRFESTRDIDPTAVLAYMEEALGNQEKGIALKPGPPKETVIPPLLQQALEQDATLRESFGTFTPYKQREFCEHINGAKQERTKEKRLQQCIPMIRAGIGLNDKYRK